MEEVVIPLHPEGMVKDPGDNRFVVDTMVDISSQSDKTIGKVLDDIECRLSSNGVDIVKHENFDPLYGMMRRLVQLKMPARRRLLSILQEGLSDTASSCSRLLKHIEAASSDEKLFHRNALKMYMFLMHWFITSSDRTTQAKKSKSKRGKAKAGDADDEPVSVWASDERKERVLSTLVHVLEVEGLSRLWNLPTPEEDFLALFLKTVTHLLESPASVRCKPVRKCIQLVMALLVAKHGQTIAVSTALLHSLHKYEHVPVPFAEMIEMVAVEYKSPQFVSELMREIGRLDPQELVGDTGAAKNVALLVAEVAERVPTALLPCISALIPHLDCESYAMRNGVIQALGFLVATGFTADRADGVNARSRDSLLDILEERFRDVTSYTRSKVLQTWIYLCEAKAIPLKRLATIVELTIGRLEDRAAQVRRNAVVLLTKLLQYNPYSAELRLTAFRRDLDKIEKQLKEVGESVMENLHEEQQQLEEEGAAEKEKEEEEDGDDAMVVDDEEVDVAFSPVVEIPLADQGRDGEKQGDAVDKDHDADEMSEGDEDQADPAASIAAAEEEGPAPRITSEQVEKLEQLRRFLRSAVHFIEQVHNAIPVLCQLLGSNNSFDVLEAVSFFTAARSFKIEVSEIGVRKMLVLIFSKDESIRSAVIDAYHALYLAPSQRQDRTAAALEVAYNLISLTRNANVAEITSIEGLVAEFMEQHQLSNRVIRALLEVFAGKPDGVEADQSVGALMILAMAAHAKPAIVQDRLQLVVTVGLGPRARTNPSLARWTCVALQKLAVNAKSKSSKSSAPVRFKTRHPIFKRLVEMLTQGDDVSTTLSPVLRDEWFMFAEQAINTIYLLAESPDALCTGVVRSMADMFFGSKRGVQQQESEPSQEGDEAEANGCDTELASQQSSIGDGPSKRSCTSFQLSKFLFVLGHVALKQLVHLDNIQSELRRRRSVHQKRSIENERAGSKKKKSGTSNSGGADKEDQEAIEQELGLDDVVATEDMEADYIQHIAEQELVCNNLLGAFAPLVLRVCLNKDNTFNHKLVRSHGVLALCKFMVVSSQFCEQNLQLLFTVLERADNPTDRANLVISVGDLAVRYPNLIEPWTSKVYARLSDESAAVRKKTLMVLTHLILNDMVKVKGQISEMARCLEDVEPRIRELARLFFHELAQKANAIYNILPDVISILSSTDDVTSSQFRSIMKNLFGFIEKDKHFESLVDKLLLRFRATSSVEQWRDISYCLSLITYNEKSIRKLSEAYTSVLKDKLTDDVNAAYFAQILSRAKKFAKPDLKTAVDELEAKISEGHRVKEDGEEDDDEDVEGEKAEKLKVVPTKKRPKRQKKMYYSDEDEDSDVELMDTDDEEEEEEEEEDESPNNENAKRGGNAQSKKKTTATSKTATTSSSSRRAKGRAGR